MSARRTLATTVRVLSQLRRDHRTIAMLLVVPVVLLTLLRYVFDGSPQVFDRVGAPLLALFPFTTMFVVTSVAMLRERSTGTLERLLTTPLAKLDLLMGYAIAFSLVALVQVGIASAVTLGPLGLEVTGSSALLVLIAILDALLGMALGLFTSAFARTEFQAVQFLPAFVLPQVLLCGLLTPRSVMAEPLQWLSNALPLSYAFDAMSTVTRTSETGAGLVQDVAVVAAFTVGALVLGAATLRRQTD